jgi:hypothetical protein
MGLLERVEVDQTAAYSGFDIDVRDVLIGVDPVGFDVAQVNVVLANRTSGRARLQTAVEIESQGAVAVVDRDATPQLDAGASGEGYFSLRLAESFRVADAVLFIGRPDRNRVQVPLGESGELVTRAPLLVAATSSAADETSSIALTGVTVAWDSADPRAQSEPGSAFLRVDYTLDSTVATALSDDVLSLRLPSGDLVEPENASIGAIDAGQTTEGLFGLFLVSDPARGDYALLYSERFGNGGVELPFTVP